MAREVGAETGRGGILRSSSRVTHPTKRVARELRQNFEEYVHLIENGG